MNELMVALVTFLLNRIENEEMRAQLRLRHAQQNHLMLQDSTLLGNVIPGWSEWPEIETMATHVLAECEAQRRIIKEILSYTPELEHGDNGEWAFTFVLRTLALPFSDHPDYQQEWKL